VSKEFSFGPITCLKDRFSPFPVCTYSIPYRGNWIDPVFAIKRFQDVVQAFSCTVDHLQYLTAYLNWMDTEMEEAVGLIGSFIGRLATQTRQYDASRSINQAGIVVYRGVQMISAYPWLMDLSVGMQTAKGEGHYHHLSRGIWVGNQIRETNNEILHLFLRQKRA